MRIDRSASNYNRFTPLAERTRALKKAEKSIYFGNGRNNTKHANNKSEKSVNYFGGNNANSVQTIAHKEQSQPSVGSIRSAATAPTGARNSSGALLYGASGMVLLPGGSGNVIGVAGNNTVIG